MIINDCHKFVFVHVPKNGGTSMQAAFNNLRGTRNDLRQSSHETIGEIDKRLPQYRSFYRWCLIREPFSRVSSAYRYLCWRFPERMGSFRDYVMSLEREQERSSVAKTQAYFAKHPTMHYWPFSAMQHSVDQVAKRLGFTPPKVPLLNQSPHSSVDYTDEVRDEIRRVYAEDFELHRKALDASSNC